VSDRLLDAVELAELADVGRTLALWHVRRYAGTGVRPGERAPSLGRRSLSRLAARRSERVLWTRRPEQSCCLRKPRDARRRVPASGRGGARLLQIYRGGAAVTGRLPDAVEVAERLNVPVSWVRESTRSGAMPCVELGERVGRVVEHAEQQGAFVGRQGHDAHLAFETAFDACGEVEVGCTTDSQEQIGQGAAIGLADLDADEPHRSTLQKQVFAFSRHLRLGHLALAAPDEVSDGDYDDGEDDRVGQEPRPPAVSCEEHIDLRCWGRPNHGAARHSIMDLPQRKGQLC
jgi:hypothetical protein